MVSYRQAGVGIVQFCNIVSLIVFLYRKIFNRNFILPRSFPAVLIIFGGRGRAGNSPLNPLTLLILFMIYGYIVLGASEQKTRTDGWLGDNTQIVTTTRALSVLIMNENDASEGMMEVEEKDVKSEWEAGALSLIQGH